MIQLTRKTTAALLAIALAGVAVAMESIGADQLTVWVFAGLGVVALLVLMPLGEFLDDREV